MGRRSWPVICAQAIGVAFLGFGAIAVLVAMLLLSGCTGSQEQQYVLVVETYPRTTYVVARVAGPKADLYRWEWGDGNVDETGNPEQTHTYSAQDVFVLTVKVYKLVGAGNGQPGVGTGSSPSLVATLTAVVDLRPPVVLDGFEVVVLNPPPWWNPNAWPADCYPSACNLKLYALVRFNNPNAGIKVSRTLWTVLDEWDRFMFQSEGDSMLFPAEQFLAGGCGGGSPRKGYKILLQVVLTNGEILKYSKMIYACPPSGCG